MDSQKGKGGAQARVYVYVVVGMCVGSERTWVLQLFVWVRVCLNKSKQKNNTTTTNTTNKDGQRGSKKKEKNQQISGGYSEVLVKNNFVYYKRQGLIEVLLEFIRSKVNTPLRSQEGAE